MNALPTESDRTAARVSMAGSALPLRCWHECSSYEEPNGGAGLDGCPGVTASLLARTPSNKERSKLAAGFDLAPCVTASLLERLLRVSTRLNALLVERINE
jgi:hypothetical protein